MPRRKPNHTLLSAGASLISLGLIFLLLPAMLGTRPVMNAIGGKLGSDENYSSHLGQQQSFRELGSDQNFMNT